MSTTQIVLITAVAVLVLGIIVLPLFNRRQFRRLDPNLQIRIIMKEAKGLIYFKNVSNGTSGNLYYVKNKRKILVFPWVLSQGNMLVTRQDPFKCWDYPAEHEPLNSDELKQLLEEIEKYNKKNPIKLIFK